MQRKNGRVHLAYIVFLMTQSVVLVITLGCTYDDLQFWKKEATYWRQEVAIEKRHAESWQNEYLEMRTKYLRSLTNVDQMLDIMLKQAKKP